MSGAAILEPASVPETIRAKTIELVGQYAIQIFWSDGHETGIYSFRDLRQGCPCDDCARIRAAGGTPA
jgi:ATP-binding protein involved in chromosome partitioning